MENFFLKNTYHMYLAESMNANNPRNRWKQLTYLYSVAHLIHKSLSNYSRHFHTCDRLNQLQTL
jgi:hypothetical protein